MAASTGSQVLAREWQNTYDNIKKDHDEAYFCIDKAIKLEEEGKKDEAVAMYEFGLSLIDKALGTPMECPANPDIGWEKTYALIQKMRKTRKEVLLRISDCQTRQHPDSVAPPPSYEEAMATTPIYPQFPIPGPSAPPDLQSPSGLQPYAPSSTIFDSNLSPPSSSQSAAAGAPSYSDLMKQLNELKVETTQPGQPPGEILFKHDNVRLYFIAPDGRVSSTSEPDTLYIARVDGPEDSILDDVLSNIVAQLSSDTSSSHHGKRHHRHHRRHGRRHHHHRHSQSKDIPAEIVSDEEAAGDLPYKVYLQVGPWIYPLISGISPCYQSEYGALILPDLNSHIPGAAVGIILPSGSDTNILEVLNTFIHVADKAELEQPVRPGRRSKREKQSDKYVHPFASNLVKGANYLSEGFIKGATHASKFIDGNTPKLINKMQPGPEQPVNPTLLKSLEVAKTVSGKAVSATDYMADKVGTASAALGRYLAPYIQQQGTSMLQSTTKMSQQEASSRMSTTLNIAAGAVQGFTTVYVGLQSAAVILARSLSQNTVQIIQYKYGLPAGQLASDSFSTAGNVLTTQHNLKMLKPKGMAKVAAKETGKAVLEDYKIGNGSSHPEFKGPGPGDGSGFGPLEKEKQ